MKSRLVQYYVEGDDEKKLLDVLKTSLGVIRPGKVQKLNVIEQRIRYTLEASTPVILDGERTAYSAAWYDLEGCLVRVNSSAVGKGSVSALTGGTGQDLDVKGRTLGSLPLADDVKIYDQVGAAPVVEVGLEDILTDTVAHSRIAYVGTDEDGRVDLLLLKDVTGDAYTYGRYRFSTASSGKKDSEDYSEWRTIAVVSASGTSAYCAGTRTLRDTFGGLAVTAGGKIAGFQALTKVTGVARSAFDGEDYVVLDGVRVPISDSVQVYNSDNDAWIDLAAAKGYGDTMTAYYSGTLGGDAKVRVIAVGE